MVRLINARDEIGWVIKWSFFISFKWDDKANLRDFGRIINHVIPYLGWSKAKRTNMACVLLKSNNKVKHAYLLSITLDHKGCNTSLCKLKGRPRHLCKEI